jgi:hypothetical protein
VAFTEGAAMGLTAIVVLSIAAAAVAFATWRAKQRGLQEPIVPPAPQPAPTVAKGDAPTVRLGESQRIDRLHKVLSLKVGEHDDLLDLTFDGIPRLRISLASVEQIAADEKFPAARDCARIHLELGGAIAGCGALVKEVAVNQFWVPQATADEQRCSILHFHGKDDIVNFLRIKVLRLNVEQATADIDVLHVSGHWAG